MTDCQRYLEDPEAHAAHVESCAACSILFDALGEEAVDVAPRPVRVDALPMATWEGASHRTWPLVITGAVSVLILAVVLFLAAGVSPARGLVSAIVAEVPSLDFLMNLSQLAGGALHHAPPAFHVAVAVSFVVINTLLFVLLRRAPKGLDV